MFANSNTFTFDNKNSVDYNVRIAYFDELTISPFIREISKNENNSKQLRSHIYNVKNSENIVFEFSIVKGCGEPITQEESIEINEWLLTDVPKELYFNDEDAFEQLFYFAICTQIEDVFWNSKLMGKRIKFETDSTYAFTRPFIYRINQDSSDLIIKNLADINYYPIIKIKECVGKLNIINTTANNINMEIDLSQINKDIIIDCENMIITDLNYCPIPMSNVMSDESCFLFLQKGINKLKIVSETVYSIEIICRYPRKAGNM